MYHKREQIDQLLNQTNLPNSSIFFKRSKNQISTQECFAPSFKDCWMLVCQISLWIRDVSCAGEARSNE